MSDNSAVVENTATSPTSSPYEKPVYRYYVLGLLTLVYALSIIDRQILVIVQESIKIEMQLSDTQLGLLSGFAFALFYVTLGLPIARWADNSVRKNIIGGAAAIWSIMTAVCGLANSYTQLLLARVGVGVGEAGCSPPAHSIIADIFPAEKRGFALSVYSSGISIGIIFGLLLGGWISQHYGWRMAFIALGLPGLGISLLIFSTLKEPLRGMADNISNVGESAPPIKDVLALLWSRRSFRHLAIAAALHTFVGYGSFSWIASFMIRTHGISASELGIWLAMSAGVGGVIGTLSGGYLADKLGRTDKRWYLWVPAWSTLLMLPFSLFAFSTNNVYWALSAYIVPSLLYNMWLGPNLAMTLALVKPRMRAVASAILFFACNLVGMGLGPTVIGLASDLLSPSFGDESLRYALLVIPSIVTLWCVWHYFRAAKYIRADLAKA